MAADGPSLACCAGSVGFPLPYQQLRVAVVDADGKLQRDCATDEIGTLLIAGPAVFPGYLRDRDNAQVWAVPGWLNTGDLCRVDRDGYPWRSSRCVPARA